MDSRRRFVKKTAGLIGLTAISPALKAAENFNETFSAAWPTADLSEEDFWKYVRECFTVNLNVINLNNGGVSPQPKQVQDAHLRYYQMCNEGPSLYMWRILDAGREPLRKKLANLAGTSPEELAINRNSTEGLNTIIFGLNLKAGDEVVLCKYDYPNMMNAWKQREKRDGIKLVWIDLPLVSENDKEIVSIYENAITSRTKIVHVTHMINWTGQLLPAKAIADMAHSKGCEVIVDIAHSFAQVDFKIPDTGADYAAVSLHKWLCAPFGSGLLYVKKEKIKNVWALLSNNNPDGEDIRKFESLGTRSFASEMAISAAIDFHEMIGSKRKENRLRFLKNYWAEKALKLPNVKLNTSLKPQYSCALSNFSIDGWSAAEIDQFLYDKYKIHSVGIVHEKINGVRITPSVYTSASDLDILVEAIHEMAKTTPPKK
jgi:selenocysteine lyase/cysteine desulfurase